LADPSVLVKDIKKKLVLF